MTPLARFAAAIAVLAIGTPVSAHHSGAMFDRSKEVVIKGTIKEVQWVNPHAWLEVLAEPDATGKQVQWSFEFGGGAASLRGMGMTKSNPSPGDKVTVFGYPLRDGRTGAAFKRVVLADGKAIPSLASAAAAPVAR